MSLTVGFVLALYGLIAVPLVVLLALRSKFLLSPRRRVMATTTRSLAVALVVLAIADLRIGWPTDDLAVAVAIDGSDGISDAERTTLRQSMTQLEASRPDVRFVHPSVRRPNEPEPSIASALGAATATLPRDHVRRVIVATDGRDESGDLASAIAAAHDDGIEVDVLPIGDRPPVDLVSIPSIDAPRLVHAEETVDVAPTIFASRETDTHLEAFLDGTSVATTDHHALAGDSNAHLSIRFPNEPGVHELEVAVTASGDAIDVNDRWRALVEVLPKPRVLILHDASDTEPALVATLRDAGMEVEVRIAPAAPTSVDAYDPFALVIADEIELGDFSDVQQTALRSWVEDEGGGWIRVTGGRPVRSTPRTLREIEPIGPPPAQPEPRPLELVIVIDRSGSMSGGPMAQAQSAAVAAVHALRLDAHIGVVAFSGQADRTIGPYPMSEATRVITFIRGIYADGGTNIAAAVQAANHIMSHDDRYIHHVVLISDGESEPVSARAAATALAGRGVSISTITIGSYSALLADIARIGRGRYHVTASASGLSSLVVSEAMARQPPAQRQTTFVAHEQTHLAMLDGVEFSGAPALTGHALATLKPGATQALTATESMPLLAHWHRGLGQVATFTSSTSGAWADGWRSAPIFRRFWTSLSRGMLRHRTIEPPHIAIERDPVHADRRIVSVVSPFPFEEPAPIARIARGRETPTPLELSIAGPGVWQASVPAGFTFLVDARLPLDPEPTSAAGDETPYDRELSRFGPERSSLDRLASIGGGLVLEAPATALTAPGEALVRMPLRMPLLFAALAIYLLSLLLIRLPDRAVASAAIPERTSRPSMPPAARTSNAPPPPMQKTPKPTPPDDQEAA
jgi:uncharacterized protein YegL